MKISITKKMSLVFAITSLIIIVMFFGVTYYSINTSFTKYINETQEERNREIINYLESVSNSKGQYSEEALMSLWHSAMMEHYYITLLDIDKNIIWKMDKESTDMMYGMMGGEESRGLYHEQSYPIRKNDKVIGYIAIGQYDSYILSAADVSFQDSLYKGLVFTALVGIIMAIILGMLNAKELASPILKIKNTADILRKGDLSARVAFKSNTKEVVELAESINHLGFSLDQQEQLRRRLTSDVSHELRTPLNVLKNHIEALMDGIWEPTYERLEICYNEVDRLTNLVKDLEKLTSLESDEMILEKRPMYIGEIIKPIVHQFEPSFYDKQIDFSFTIIEDSQVALDGNKFKQVIINLLSNALKFTDAKGRVSIGVSKNKQHAVIEVKDTGIGIDKKDLPFVFERFYRAEQSRNRKTGGAGLGLSIVKQIVEAHGGRIEVDSVFGEGTVFTLLFPSVR